MDQPTSHKYYLLRICILVHAMRRDKVRKRDPESTKETGTCSWEDRRGIKSQQRRRGMKRVFSNLLCPHLHHPHLRRRNRPRGPLRVLLFADLTPLRRLLGGIIARLEVASQHVPPCRDATSVRAPNLEPLLVDDDVLPHTTLVDRSVAVTTPLAPDHILPGVTVRPDVLSPVVDVGVVNVQLLGALSPPTLDHFQGPTGIWDMLDGCRVAHPGRFRLGLHTTPLQDRFPPLHPEDWKW